jgi:three-Cys-motif partner protein
MAGSSQVIPDTYQGREQAIVKHELLKNYLQKLFLIIGTSARPKSTVELCYVDCFAGPWADKTDDLKGTSIAISLQTLEVCQQTLSKKGISANIRALYIERNSAAYARLTEYLRQNTPDGISADCKSGDFVTLRHELLAWCGPNAFAFFFIDPTGWKNVRIETLRPLLERPRSEFLINFMYDFVNRTASMEAWQEEITQLLGEPVQLETMASSEREAKLLSTYRRNLKQCIPNPQGKYPPRSAYVRVLDPVQKRPKYHLVYLTSHPQGVIEFMGISEHVDVIQKRVRAETKARKREKEMGIKDMFGSETLIDPSEGHASVDDVDRFWIEYLREGIRKIGRGEFADILERTDWFEGDLQASLVRLIKANRVRNLDNLERRPKKPLHFEENERLQLVEPDE